jgi:hypothetical protein
VSDQPPPSTDSNNPDAVAAPATAPPATLQFRPAVGRSQRGTGAKSDQESFDDILAQIVSACRAGLERLVRLAVDAKSDQQRERNRLRLTASSVAPLLGILEGLTSGRLALESVPARESVARQCREMLAVLDRHI